MSETNTVSTTKAISPTGIAIDNVDQNPYSTTTLTSTPQPATIATAAMLTSGNAPLPSPSSTAHPLTSQRSPQTILNAHFETIQAVVLHVDNAGGVVSRISTWGNANDIWVMRHMFEDHLVVTTEGLQSLDAWLQSYRRDKDKEQRTQAQSCDTNNVPILLVPKVASVATTYAWDRMCSESGAACFVNVAHLSRNNRLQQPDRVHDNVAHVLRHMDACLGHWLAASQTLFDLVLAAWYMFVEQCYAEISLTVDHITSYNNGTRLCPQIVNRWSQLLYGVDLIVDDGHSNHRKESIPTMYNHADYGDISDGEDDEEGVEQEEDVDHYAAMLTPFNVPSVADEPWRHIGVNLSRHSAPSYASKQSRARRAPLSSSLERTVLSRAMSAASLSPAKTKHKSNRISSRDAKMNNHASSSSTVGDATSWDIGSKPIRNIPLGDFDHVDAAHVLALFPRLVAHFHPPQNSTPQTPTDKNKPHPVSDEGTTCSEMSPYDYDEMDTLLARILNRVALLTKTMVFVDAAERMIAHAYSKVASDPLNVIKGRRGAGGHQPHNAQSSETTTAPSTATALSEAATAPSPPPPSVRRTSFATLAFAVCVFATPPSELAPSRPHSSSSSHTETETETETDKQEADIYTTMARLYDHPLIQVHHRWFLVTYVATLIPPLLTPPH